MAATDSAVQTPNGTSGPGLNAPEGGHERHGDHAAPVLLDALDERRAAIGLYRRGRTVIRHCYISLL